MITAVHEYTKNEFLFRIYAHGNHRVQFFISITRSYKLFVSIYAVSWLLHCQGKLPVRWRLSCKLIVGKENKAGTVKVKAVPQAEWRSQRKN